MIGTVDLLLQGRPLLRRLEHQSGRRVEDILLRAVKGYGHRLAS
jgi:hypothetical protein